VICSAIHPNLQVCNAVVAAHIPFLKRPVESRTNSKELYS
jgi:hypothetical protein